MIDVKDEVMVALTEISGVKVYYNYPEAAVRGNIITYYELDNTIGSIADNSEYSSRISFQIDIWTKNMDDLIDLSLKVDEKMSENGFYRQMAQEIKDLENKRRRKTMRYTTLR